MRIETFEDPRLILWVGGYKNLPPGHWNHTGVSAPYWRLYWNANPGAFIHYGRQNIEIKPSMIALIAPNTVFSTSNNLTAINHLYAHFQIPPLYVGVEPQIIRVAVTALLRGLMKESIHVLRKHATSAWRLSLVIRALVEMAMSTIMHETIKVPRLDARVLKVLHFLEEHLDIDLSNADLARHAGMSVSAFSRLFKAQIGHGLHTYVSVKRIEKACLLLQFTNTSIKQIAEATGFCDRYHFSQMFARRQNISPAKFRRLHHNSPAMQ